MSNNRSLKISRLGILFPTNLEFQPFANLLPELERKTSEPWDVFITEKNGLHITVIVSYIGPANAAAATEHLMTFQPDLILHGGAAGAINPDLMPGDIVLGQHYKILCSEPILEARRSLLLSNKAIRYCQAGESVHVEQLDAPAELITMGLAAARAVEAKHPTWAAAGWPANTPRRSPRAIAGTLGSQDGWTKDLKELDFIRREFAVDSEDMESSYIAQIAAKYAVPFLAVRSISNNEYFYSLAKSEIFPAVAAAAARAAEVLARLSLNLGQTAA